MSRTVATKQKKRPGTAEDAIMENTRDKGENGERGWGLELPRVTRFIGRPTADLIGGFYRAVDPDCEILNAEFQAELWRISGLLWKREAPDRGSFS